MMSALEEEQTGEGPETGTSYPRGGLATSAGGDGIFVDQSGESLKLFVDPRVKSNLSIIRSAEVSPSFIRATVVAAYRHEGLL